MLEGHEAVVGDGHAMGEAGEIAEHMMRTAERWLGVDDPALTEQGTQEGAEGLFIFQRLERSGESELVLLESAVYTGDQLAAEHATEYENVREECGAGM